MMGRSTIFFLFSLVLLWTGCAPEYPHHTPDAFAASVFKVLQRADRAALTRFIPTQDDVFAALEQSEQNPKKREAGLKLLTRDWARLSAELEAGVDAAWRALLADVAAAGVDLGAAEFESAVAKTAEAEGFVQGDIDVRLRYGGRVYRIRIVDAGKTPRGWLLSRQGFVWEGEV